MVRALGEFKQELIKDYNDINLRMFDTGVKRHKVDILGNKVIILSLHKRINSLKYMDEKNRFVTRITDVSLLDYFKDELRILFEEKYGMNVISVLKDYDPRTEYSGTIVILDQNIENYF